MDKAGSWGGGAEPEHGHSGAGSETGAPEGMKYLG
jgi:hypothetical protein